MKPFVTVTMTLHGDVEKEVTDFVDNGGKFVPLGTEVLAMLERHEVVHYKDESGVETIIPFDSVMTYNTTKESQEYTKPEDAFCVAECEDANTDCNHPELGELMYCGSASNKAIVSDSGCDEGVSEDYCGTEEWYRTFGEPTTCNGLVGVFDGVIVPGITLSELQVKFGEYLTLTRQVDEETGDTEFVVSALTGAAHYAIYNCEDCRQNLHYSTLGYLYYCGGLQNGDIVNDETGTHDAGAIVTDSVPWSEAIHLAATPEADHKDMYLVSNGNTITATHTSESSVAFGNVGLSWEVNPETGDGRAEITNAPTHYAIYSKYNPN